MCVGNAARLRIDDPQENIDGVKALVTGAGARIGQAIAVGLAGPANHVIVHYARSKQGAEMTRSRIKAAGGRASLIQADLSDPCALESLAKDAISLLGGLDLLVCSAANFERSTADTMKMDSWQRAIELNLVAPGMLVRWCLDALRASKGSVVMITDSGSTYPYSHYVPYLAAKGGLRQTMRALALELAPDVRVNAVAPGTVLPPENMHEDDVSDLVSRIPLRGPGGAAPVVEAVKYLASATFTTGTELIVDGGACLRSAVGSGRLKPAD